MNLVVFSWCRFLTLIDTNKIRMVHLGALPLLINLASEYPKQEIRLRARSVLGNISMLAECGEQLAQNGVPEEYLLPVPICLEPQALGEVRLEFGSTAM